MQRLLTLFLSALALTACAEADDKSWPFEATEVTRFEEPWAMTFLPDGRLLVTEKPGRLLIVTRDGEKSAPVSGVPDVVYGGQGGLGDVVLHPEYASNRMIYLSYAEAGGRVGPRKTKENRGKHGVFGRYRSQVGPFLGLSIDF